MSAQVPPDQRGTPPAPSQPGERFKLGLVVGIVAALGGLIGTSAAWYESWKSARIAEQGLVTERFKDGVDELGSPDENVQAGGMFTLARVARDSSRDAATAYEVILFFVRGHLCQNKVPEPGAFRGPPQSVTAGLQILHIAGRPIDLSRLKCDVFPTDLFNVDLHSANLKYAELPGAALQQANLNGAHLDHAFLDSTDCTNGALLTGAVFTGADISSAGFQGSIGLTQDQLRQTHWSQRYPPHVDPGERSWINH